jgi:hypothetical protein
VAVRARICASFIAESSSTHSTPASAPTRAGAFDGPHGGVELRILGGQPVHQHLDLRHGLLVRLAGRRVQ